MPSIRSIDFNSATDVTFVQETAKTQDFSQTSLERTKFTAVFRVYDRGLHHCAGITFNIDGWTTRHDAFAVFDPLKSDDNKEVWKVELVFPISHDPSDHGQNRVCVMVRGLPLHRQRQQNL